MPQFFIDKELAEGQTVEIRGSDAHHISDVLRLTPGDWLVLSDGLGNSFRCTITDLKTRSVSARIGRKISVSRSHHSSGKRFSGSLPTTHGLVVPSSQNGFGGPVPRRRRK